MDKEVIKDIEREISSLDRHSFNPGEIILGEFLGFDAKGEPRVYYFGGADEGTKALSTVPVTQEHRGRQVALLFANGDFSKPVIMGIIRNPLMDILENAEIISSPKKDSSTGSSSVEQKDNDSQASEAFIDGNRVVLEGKEEIVLKCGEASITLTKAGKILIRGKYLLNRSTGVNRILGGSVQVN